MFINDIHIFIYVFLGILGLLIGRMIELIKINLIKHRKIISVHSIKEYMKNSNPNYKIMISISMLYIALLFAIGIEDKIKLIQFLLLIPLLIMIFDIDCKLQVIPVRLTVLIFELGIFFSCIRGLNNLNTAIELWLGMIFGVGIFLILTVFGNFLLKKETMGFGDVKLIGAIGLFLGWRNIILISVLSFLIASVYSIVLIIVKKIKKQEINEYIPFGPFIVIATIIIMLNPLNIFIKMLIS